jgi:NitT/TauT family transport system substrate-binding protein
MKWIRGFLAVILIILWTVLPVVSGEQKALRVAVEFTDHAASAYVAKENGWFEKEGLNVENYESYATGVALAAAMARGEIQAAYICLVPAINTFTNGKVPIKIVAGTHQYGYALVVNPSRVKRMDDLALPGVRIGCVRQGGAVDVLMQKTIERYRLPKEKVLNNVRRMDPSKMVWALKINQLDAIFVPEHWASLAESFGFKMLLTSQDIWPNMIGSVLVVSSSLLETDPATVEKLVSINKKATQWINTHPEEASAIVARYLSGLSGTKGPQDLSQGTFASDVTAPLIRRSMSRLAYTPEVDAKEIQRTIDYLYKLGYLQQTIQAQDILP